MKKITTRMAQSLLRAGIAMAVGVPMIASAATLPQLDGVWQCTSEETNNATQKSWVLYDFSEQGIVKSQEWIQYLNEREIQLEYSLFVNYQFTQKGDDYMLKPIKMAREVVSDPLDIDPFNAEQMRDLNGYRIFFKPSLTASDEAQFEMWYHITPNHHFTMDCEQKPTKFAGVSFK